MNTALVKKDILSSLTADPEYRHAWNFENVYTSLCFQLSALREQRGWSQAKLGRAAKMAQERISILEDPNAETKPTLNTLLRIADAYDVGLDVRFVPYGTVLDRSTKTNPKDLEVPSFAEELPELEREIESKAFESRMLAVTRDLTSPPVKITLDQKTKDFLFSILEAHRNKASQTETDFGFLLNTNLLGQQTVQNTPKKGLHLIKKENPVSNKNSNRRRRSIRTPKHRVALRRRAS